MIEELLPASVVAVETYGDDGFGDAPLHPEEQAARQPRGDQAPPRVHRRTRLRPRTPWRSSAWPRGAVLHGEGGAPRWPDGLAGSMTHTDGYCAAALVRATDLASLGIDAEPHRPLPEGVAPTPLSLPNDEATGRAARRPGARSHWTGSSSAPRNPSTRRGTPSPASGWTSPRPTSSSPRAWKTALSGRLRATLLVPGPVVDGRLVGVFEGRWKVERGIVTTAVTVPRGTP